jgi:hypothetical protein
MSGLELEKCPNCKRAKSLRVIFYSGGVKHDCKSCGYFMCWLVRSDEEKARLYAGEFPTEQVRGDRTLQIY